MKRQKAYVIRRRTMAGRWEYYIPSYGGFGPWEDLLLSLKEARLTLSQAKDVNEHWLGCVIVPVLEPEPVDPADEAPF